MINEASTRTISRLTGIFYLTVIVGGVFAQGFISESLVNFRDAGATASNILANKTLYRTGYTVFLIEMSAQFVTSVLFYFLLRPVSRPVALVATVLSLSGALIKTVARVFFLVPIGVLSNATTLSGFTAEQVNSLVLLVLRMNNDGATVALAFFGPSTVLHGWLIMRSGFLPKWMGIMSMIGGVLWTTYFWPPLGRSLFMVSALFALASVIIISGWLIIFGVDDKRWRELVVARGSSIWR